MVLLETYSIVKEPRVLRRELCRARDHYLPFSPIHPRRATHAVFLDGGAERD